MSYDSSDRQNKHRPILHHFNFMKTQHYLTKTELGIMQKSDTVRFVDGIVTLRCKG